MAFKLFIIAGEASGDALGAKLIRQLKFLRPNIVINGVGGVKMEAEGLKSIFPMQEISLMGLTEILPHIPNLIKRLKQTRAKIRELEPDVIVTIDSPGFNNGIVKSLQDLRPKTKFIHYVAPTVWAYKPQRAAKLASLYDHLMVILPFEPPYFTKENLDTTFVGHPLLEDEVTNGDAEKFEHKYNIKDFICMMPGSRIGELKRNLPVFKKIAENMAMDVVIVAADNVLQFIETNVRHWPQKVVIVDSSEKADCFKASKLGVIKSGTSALEYAFAGKPYVTVYKVSKITAAIARCWVKTAFVNLVNIIAGREVVKELIQENFTAENVTLELKELLEYDNSVEYKQILDTLQTDFIPSEKAAKTILAVCNQ